jgi:hypothetical protein
MDCLRNTKDALSHGHTILDIWKHLYLVLVLLFFNGLLVLSFYPWLYRTCHPWDFSFFLTLDSAPIPCGWRTPSLLDQCAIWLINVPASKPWCTYSPLPINTCSCSLARLTCVCKVPRCTSLQMTGRFGSSQLRPLSIRCLDKSFIHSRPPVRHQCLTPVMAMIILMKCSRLVTSSSIRERTGDWL